MAGPFAPRYGVEWMNLAILAVGWIALFESFAGWCWLHEALGIDSKKQ